MHCCWMARRAVCPSRHRITSIINCSHSVTLHDSSSVPLSQRQCPVHVFFLPSFVPHLASTALDRRRLTSAGRSTSRSARLFAPASIFHRLRVSSQPAAGALPGHLIHWLNNWFIDRLIFHGLRCRSVRHLFCRDSLGVEDIHSTLSSVRSSLCLWRTLCIGLHLSVLWYRKFSNLKSQEIAARRVSEMFKTVLCFVLCGLLCVRCACS